MHHDHPALRAVSLIKPSRAGEQGWADMDHHAGNHGDFLCHSSPAACLSLGSPNGKISAPILRYFDERRHCRNNPGDIFRAVYTIADTCRGVLEEALLNFVVAVDVVTCCYPATGGTAGKHCV